MAKQTWASKDLSLENIPAMFDGELRQKWEHEKCEVENALNNTRQYGDKMKAVLTLKISVSRDGDKLFFEGDVQSSLPKQKKMKDMGRIVNGAVTFDVVPEQLTLDDPTPKMTIVGRPE